MEKDTPAANILMLDKLMHHALSLGLYNIAKTYYIEIINATTLLEQSVIELEI
jgi:hypothetical protein